jgi:hypothetical protein
MDQQHGSLRKTLEANASALQDLRGKSPATSAHIFPNLNIVQGRQPRQQFRHHQRPCGDARQVLDTGLYEAVSAASTTTSAAAVSQHVNLAEADPRMVAIVDVAAFTALWDSDLVDKCDILIGPLR